MSTTYRAELVAETASKLLHFAVFASRMLNFLKSEFLRFFSKKIFQGRTRWFQISMLHTPGTPLRGLIPLIIKYNAA